MGTRGTWGFVKNGVRKMTYSQYDSYADGLGVEVYNFCKEAGVKKLNEIFERITKTPCESDEFSQEDFENYKEYYEDVSTGKDYYSLLRKLQNSPSMYLEDDNLDIMAINNEFLFDDTFCEYGYVINLDINSIEIYRYGERLEKTIPIPLSNDEFCEIVEGE